MREENILADAQELTAFIKRKVNRNRSLTYLKIFRKIEIFLRDNKRRYRQDDYAVLRFVENNGLKRYFSACFFC
ncbi:hypothetical protein [Paenibacillus sp. S150]|uniref:hypothetical protein n=1 Tax=Paenibacillus sp. S150 TaxID=2749826 RepID=UPI001C574CA8|nr:hypothetical protein [Paenibacillus sp. S150]MBW4081980.1 hypothetical protein [Paenibacillus sp. S150]